MLRAPQFKAPSRRFAFTLPRSYALKWKYALDTMRSFSQAYKIPINEGTNKQTNKYVKIYFHSISAEKLFNVLPCQLETSTPHGIRLLWWIYLRSPSLISSGCPNPLLSSLSCLLLVSRHKNNGSLWFSLHTAAERWRGLLRLSRLNLPSPRESAGDFNEWITSQT